jgi:hypothetical protein
MNQASEIFEAGRRVIEQAKKDILSTVAKKAASRINEISGGQLSPEIRETEVGVSILLPVSANTPEGQKLMAVEKKTKAFETALQELQSSDAIAKLVNVKG